MKTKIIIILLFVGYLVYVVDYSQRVTKEEWKQTVLEQNF